MKYKQAFALPFAFAEAVKYDADAKIKGHKVVVGVWEGDEVVVCTTPDKSKGYVVGSVSNKDLFDYAIERAIALLESMAGAGGFRHFGCARVSLGG